MVQIGSINISLPGSQMYTEQECIEDPSKYKTESMFLSGTSKIKDKKTGKTKVVNDSGRVLFKIRKCIPAIMVVPIYDIQYEAWVSNEVPSFSNMKAWKKLSKDERVLAHINEIAESRNGKLIDWAVNLDE